MKKEGLQTRKRKQKGAAGTAKSKSKSSKCNRRGNYLSCFIIVQNIIEIIWAAWLVFSVYSSLRVRWQSKLKHIFITHCRTFNKRINYFLTDCFLWVCQSSSVRVGLLYFIIVRKNSDVWFKKNKILVGLYDMRIILCCFRKFNTHY